MKSRVLLVALAFSFLFPALRADNRIEENTVLYDEAMLAYQGGNYRKTLELLRGIEQQSPNMLYLMGDAANRLQQYGYALAYWRAAQHVWPMQGRVHLAKIISQIKSKMGVESALQASTRAAIVVSDVLRALPILLIQLIFLVLWTFLFLYLRYLYQRKHRKLVVALFSLLFIAGAVLVAKISVDRKLHAVVVVPTTAILSGPGKTFHTVGNFKEGTEVKVVKTADSFYKVRLGRLVGWVMKDHVVRTVAPF